MTVPALTGYGPVDHEGPPFGVQRHLVATVAGNLLVCALERELGVLLVIESFRGTPAVDDVAAVAAASIQAVVESGVSIAVCPRIWEPCSKRS